MMEKQSRMDSAMETVTNTAIGLAVAMVANAIILPVVLGVPVPLSHNIAIAAGFTVVSILRQYIIRRLFNGRSVWRSIRDHDWFGRSHPGDPTPAEMRLTRDTHK